MVVVGGGLAGMAAAVALESAGCDVTLLEARRALGGRAGSFEEPQSGEELDNCQHVLLGCCTNLLDFYDRVGVRDRIHFESAIRFLDEHGHSYALSGTAGLPAPLHLGPAMLRFGLLTWSERVAAGRAMLAMMRVSPQEREKLDAISFGQWLDEHHQPTSLLKKLYDPVLVGALNEQTRDASAAYAIQVFQGSLLSNSRAYVMGVPAVPLSRLYERLPCKDVRLGVRVDELIFASPGSVSGVKLTGGELLAADAVVLATNHHAVRRWVPDASAEIDARFRNLDAFESVPILGVHLRFDRPVLKHPHVALVEGPLQWLFRKDAEGRELHGVISAAREWTSRPKDECLALFERQVRAALPQAQGANLERGVTVIEKRATFSPKPGLDKIRPRQGPPPGGVENLFLAGDYTKTGWPATMEGAVRSGYLAAEALLRRQPGGRAPATFVRPDLPIQWPSRLLEK